MRTEYFPSSDTLSFVFSENQVEDGRDVEGDEDVLVLYDAQNRVVEIVVHHASRRVDLGQISANIVAGEPEEVSSNEDEHSPAVAP